MKLYRLLLTASALAGLCLAASLAAADPIDAGAEAQAFPLTRPSVVPGGFTDVPDSAIQFTISAAPGLVIDDTLMFGILSAPTYSRSSAPGLPEPASLALVAFATALFGALRRPRR